MFTGKRRSRRRISTSRRQSTQRRARFTRQLGLGLERLEERTLLATTSFGPATAVQAGGADIHVGGYSVPSLTDWNSDGLTDLIVAEKTANSEGKVRVYLNSGSNEAPVFGPSSYARSAVSDLSVPASGCMGVFPRVFDWNQDGMKDLVMGLADGTVQVALNEHTDTDPIFASPIPVQVGQPGAKSDIDVGARATLDIVDWNNDGRNDLVLGDLDGNVRALLNEANSGSPDFRTEVIVLNAATGQGVPTGRASVSVTDLDGDGGKDLVVGNTEGQVLFYANVGTDAAPQFAGYEAIKANGSDIDLPDYPRSRPFVGDFNSDGTVDLLVGAEDGLVRLYIGGSTGTPHMDFGDAPTPYPTTMTEDGARHEATGPTLGMNRDVEPDGIHSANADADDATGEVATDALNEMQMPDAPAESEAEAENGAEPDLVAFGELLALNDVKLYGARWCHHCILQKRLFEDGVQFLPFIDLYNADGTRNDVEPAITSIPAWDFPDGNGGTKRVVGRLTLEQISAESGIAIPTSDTPWVKPVDETIELLAGSPLHLPLDGYDPNGDPLTYVATVEDANGDPTSLLSAQVVEGNQSMRVNVVSHAGGFTMDMGEMVFELFEQRVPRPTGRLIELTNTGFYDDSYFYRLEPGFVLQAGGRTPTQVGSSSLGTFDDQFHVDLQHNRDGVLSYAKGTDDTNDASYFVTLAPARHLDFNYSVAGQLVEGFDLLRDIQQEPVVEVDGYHSPEYPKQAGVLPSFAGTEEPTEIFTDTENAVVMLKADQAAIGQEFTVTVAAEDADGNVATISFLVVVAADIPENGGANGGPFLDDIDDVVIASNTLAQIQLSAVDVEGDPVFFDAWHQGNVAYQLDVNNETGLVTLTPPQGFVGQMEVRVAVRALNGSDTNDTWDTQLVTVTVGGVVDDEDGVTFTPITVGQSDAMVTVNVQNAPDGAKLDAWIDFDGDGSWSGSAERIANGMSVIEGDNTVTFDAPDWAHGGPTFARFRLSTVGGLGVGGLALDGEVEDYQVTIEPQLDFGDAPAGYPVTLEEDGARHVATGPSLGVNRDIEPDGIHSVSADADDVVGEVASEAPSGDPMSIATAESEAEAENGTSADLVAFAKTLTLNDVRFYGSGWCHNCVTLKKSFEDGAELLNYTDLFDANGTRNDVLPGLQYQPAMEYPDGNGGTILIDDQEGLTLERISALTGIPIPMSSTPWLKPIDEPQTVLTGSPYHIPLDGYDPNGDPLTYDITVRDANGDPADHLLTAEVLQNNRSLKVNLLSRPSDTPGVAGDTAFYLGEMVFELFEQRAPVPSGRVIELVDSGHYDDKYMWRMEPRHLFQFGGPTPTTSGSSVLGDFDDQFDVDLQHNRGGILSFAKKPGKDDSNDAEFFLTLDAIRALDFNYSIFGQMVEGFELLETIRGEAIFVANPDGDGNPNNDIHNPEFPKQVGVLSALAGTENPIEVFTDRENGVAVLKADPDAVGQEFTITVMATDPANNQTTISFDVSVTADTPENGGANGQPFLEDIGEVAATSNTPTQIQLSGIDVEGDPVIFYAERRGIVNYQLDVNSDTGLVTVTPPDGFVGELEVLVGVRAENGANTADRSDQQIVTIDVTRGALSLDLLPGSDSNIPDDNVTNIPGLVIRVSGALSGALVEILDGDTVVGQGVASSDVDITTDILDDGVHTLTARQTLDGVQGERSAELQITVDTTAPPPFTSTPPTTATVGAALVYDAQNPEEGITGLYSLVNAPDGASIDADTGVVTWTPSQQQAGLHAFQIKATDLAGNGTTQDLNVEVFVPRVRITLLTTDAQGNPIERIQVGSDYQLRALVKDVQQPPSADSGVFSSYITIRYDSSLVSANANGPQDVFFADEYKWLQSADFGTPGSIADVGSAAAPDPGSPSLFPPFGPQTMLQFAIPMTAMNEGEVEFLANPSNDELLPIAVFGSNDAVPPQEVVILGTSLVIGEGLLARDDLFNVDEDSSDNVLDVINNPNGRDENPSGGAVTIISVGVCSNGGNVSISDGRVLSYTPARDFFGVDEFTYTISNGQSTSTATVIVQVHPLNDDPSAVNDTFTVEQGSQSNFLDVLKNDSSAPDQDESLQVTTVANPSQGGTATIGLGGTHILYTPADGFIGKETIDYTISDGNGGTDEANVTVTVEREPSPVDDEEGVVLTPIVIGQPGAIATVNVQNAPDGAKLDAWIDFNRDGTWDEYTEQIADSRDVVEGDNAIIFDVPSWAKEGTTFARFRLSTAGNLGVSGWAPDGEVEDHPVTIVDRCMPGVAAYAYGAIDAIGDADEYELKILGGPNPGVYSFVVVAETGSLDPDAVQVLDASGVPVQVTTSIRDVNDGTEQSVVVASLSPGLYRLLVAGQRGTVGGYRLEMRMPGDLDCHLDDEFVDNAVVNREVQLAQAAMLQRNFAFDLAAQDLFGQKLGIDLSVDQFRAEFDANLNGHIDAMDIDAIITNHGNGAAVPVQATLSPVGCGCVAGGMGESGDVASVKLSEIGLAVFQNPVQPTDVNADKYVTPLDALLVIEAINAHGPGILDVAIGGFDQQTGEGEPEVVVSSPFYDVNGDYTISPVDVLLVISDLVASGSRLFDAPSPEGEAVTSPVPNGSNVVWPGSLAIEQSQSRQTIATLHLGQQTAVVGPSPKPDSDHMPGQQQPVAHKETEPASLSDDESLTERIGLESDLFDRLVEDVAAAWGP